MKNPHQIKIYLIKAFWLTLAALIGFYYAKYIIGSNCDTDVYLELIAGSQVLVLLMIIELSIAGLIHLFVKKEQ
jgi:hypothetical protein